MTRTALGATLAVWVATSFASIARAEDSVPTSEVKQQSVETPVTPMTTVESGASSPDVLDIHGGQVEFHAQANLKALAVHGHSRSVKGSLELVRRESTLTLRKVQVQVPADSLTTGMAVRDQHMRERIFKTASGELPPVTFEAESMDCPVRGTEAECEVSGTLSIRNVSRSVRLPVHIALEGNGLAHATGKATVKLSAYGIEAPKQYGVSIADEVSFGIDLLGAVRRGALSQR